MNSIKLKIVSASGLLVSEECSIITLASTGGIVQIMAGHENMLIHLVAGDIIYDGKSITAKSGFAKIYSNTCEILIEN
jgi:F0F1-type ATP synthase epsilon subunit